MEKRDCDRETAEKVFFQNVDERYIFSSLPKIVIREFADDDIIATIFGLKVFGHGRSEEEALQSLRNTVLDYYEEMVEGDLVSYGKVPKEDFLIFDKFIRSVGPSAVERAYDTLLKMQAVAAWEEERSDK